MTVKLRNSGWELGGTALPWVWGQINYWDVERSRWHDVLKTYRLAGHQVVSTTVLPRVHQTGPGEYDFGKVRPQNDLAAFLAEAKEVGLKVVLKVGPRNCPGVAASGYPEELITDSNALARDANGNVVLSTRGFGGEVFTLPCLISEHLTKALQPFAEKLKQITQSWIHPDGPIIGIGLTQAPGWGAALPAFAADYHTDAIHYYHSFIKKQYSKIANLNTAYETDFTSFSAIHPPQSIDKKGEYPEVRFLDWARFREDYFVQAAERLHGLFSGMALDRIPIFISTIPATKRPANLGELEKSRCFSYAMPEPLQEQDTESLLCIANQTRFLTSMDASMTSTLDDEQLFRKQKEIAYGVRGWDALSPAGSGMLSGFVSDRQGTPVRPRVQLWELLQELAAPEGFLGSQISADVLLLTMPDLERAAYLLSDPPIRKDLLGVFQATQVTESQETVIQKYQADMQQMENFLLKNQFSYLKADAEATLDRLSKSEMLLVTGSKHMPENIQRLIVQLHGKGLAITIIGDLPKHPDEASFASLSTLVEVKPKKVKKTKVKTKTKAKIKAAITGRLYHMDTYDETKLLRLLKQAGVPRPLTIDHQNVAVFYHKFRNRLFVAVVNSAYEAIETVVRRDGKFVLKDFWQENKYWGGNNEIKIVLPPRQVKFWELISC
jgi:glycosyl hydrolase family 35/glycosyl hydrolase family 42 (putative beta-galactosidase)